jgi:hypothetical protein
MSQSKSNHRRSPTPTLCEVRTLIPKQTHDILATAAKETGLPVSVLVNRIIAVACQELLREGASDEQQRDMESPVSDIQPGEYSARPAAVAEPSGPDDSDKSAQVRVDIL